MSQKRRYHVWTVFHGAPPRFKQFIGSYPNYFQAQTVKKVLSVSDIAVIARDTEGTGGKIGDPVPENIMRTEEIWSGGDA